MQRFGLSPQRLPQGKESPFFNFFFFDVACRRAHTLALESAPCVTKEQPFWEGELRQGDFVFVFLL